MLGKHLRFSPANLAAIVDAFTRSAGGRRTRRRKAPPATSDNDLSRPNAVQIEASAGVSVVS